MMLGGTITLPKMGMSLMVKPMHVFIWAMEQNYGLE